MNFILTGNNPCWQIYREGEKQFFNYNSFDNMCITEAAKDRNKRLITEYDQWAIRHDELVIFDENGNRLK